MKAARLHKRRAALQAKMTLTLPREDAVGFRAKRTTAARARKCLRLGMAIRPTAESEPES